MHPGPGSPAGRGILFSAEHLGQVVSFQPFLHAKHIQLRFMQQELHEDDRKRTCETLHAHQLLILPLYILAPGMSVTSLSYTHSSDFLSFRCLTKGRICSSTIPPKNFQGNSTAANSSMGHQCPVKNAAHSSMVAKAIEVSRGD